ncbi:AAA family ATPase [Paenibacillus sp. D2_2]|uniref:AAA family ATPase n=1 Tax=Paenibacillus sp. D2_2 TaxID=3073092 RepID=UPI002814DB86|nr:AAA family ATPase [Paenibacillus sp. D2_2]WMT42272.1 AAA family ATPase [Paenibacillus sp. D2_2]
MANSYSTECLEILDLLKRRRNVLLSGAPGTGKSRLLGEVAEAFVTNPIVFAPTSLPIHDPSSVIAIPREIEEEVDTALQSVWPGTNRNDRKVYRTAFHQNSKNREFITGLMPLTNGQSGFRVVKGSLYRASEYAKLPNGASLLIIDEINRGPAVQVFGGSIVSIEPEKRLAEDNSIRTQTQSFEIIDPVSGDIIEYALPEHLYILAAMNQADASVEPLDVAFLRRWAPYRLVPNSTVLRKYYSVSTTNPIPTTPLDEKQVMDLGIRAWEEINKQIRLGRGPEFQLGHGIFLSSGSIPNTIDEALLEMVHIWETLKTHVEEVFFGDLRGIASAINVIGGPTYHPYKLVESTFADEPRLELVGPAVVNVGNIYDILRAVVG